MSQFLFIIRFDRGGMQTCHAAEILRIHRSKSIESICTGTVDIRQQHGSNTGIYSTLHSIVAVGIKCLVVKVGMSVDKYHFDWMISVNKS